MANAVGAPTLYDIIENPMDSKSEPILDAVLKRKRKENHGCFHLYLAKIILNFLAGGALALGVLAIYWIQMLPELESSEQNWFTIGTIVIAPILYILLKAMGEACAILVDLKNK